MTEISNIIYNSKISASYKFDRENVYVWSNTRVIDDISNQSFASIPAINSNLQHQIYVLSNQAFISAPNQDAVLLEEIDDINDRIKYIQCNDIQPICNFIKDLVSEQNRSNAINQILAIDQEVDMLSNMLRSVSNDLVKSDSRLYGTSNQLFIITYAYSNLDRKIVDVSNEAYSLNSNTVYNLYERNSNAAALNSNRLVQIESNMPALSNDIYSNLVDLCNFSYDLSNEIYEFLYPSLDDVSNHAFVALPAAINTLTNQDWIISNQAFSTVPLSVYESCNFLYQEIAQVSNQIYVNVRNNISNVSNQAYVFLNQGVQDTNARIDAALVSLGQVSNFAHVAVTKRIDRVSNQSYVTLVSNLSNQSTIQWAISNQSYIALPTLLGYVSNQAYKALPNSINALNNDVVSNANRHVALSNAYRALYEINSNQSFKQLPPKVNQISNFVFQELLFSNDVYETIEAVDTRLSGLKITTIGSSNRFALTIDGASAKLSKNLDVKSQIQNGTLSNVSLPIDTTGIKGTSWFLCDKWGLTFSNSGTTQGLNLDNSGLKVGYGPQVGGNGVSPGHAYIRNILCVGTATPYYTTTIAGDYPLALLPKDSGDNSSALLFHIGGFATGAPCYISAIRNGYTGNKLLPSDATSTRDLVINANNIMLQTSPGNGNVAIGSSSLFKPAEKLHVNGTLIATDLLTASNAARINGSLTMNVGRGDVYFSDNTNDNVDGAGITLRTGTNPVSGSIFSVRSVASALRLWVGQYITSSGGNDFGVGGDGGLIQSYKVRLYTNGNIVCDDGITAGGSITSLSGSFIGDGIGLTNIAASQLTGTLSANVRFAVNTWYASTDLVLRIYCANNSHTYIRSADRIYFRTDNQHDDNIYVDRNIIVSPTFSGSFSGNGASVTSINANNITSGTLNAARLANNSIPGSSIQTNSITSSQLAPDSVRTSELADGAVDNAAIGTDAVDGRAIASGAVTNTHIGNNAVNDAKISDVDANKITGIWGSGRFRSGSFLSISETPNVSYVGANYVWNTAVFAKYNANLHQLGIAFDVWNGNIVFRGSSNRSGGYNTANDLVFIRNQGTGAGNVAHFNGNLYSTGSYLRASDIRLKSHAKPIYNATDTMLKLAPLVYRKWNTFEQEKGEDATFCVESGLIAQDVYAIPELKHMVQVPSDSNTSLGMDYSGLIAFLVKSVQELKGEINELRSELNKR
jgi:hypothetical protein